MIGLATGVICILTLWWAFRTSKPPVPVAASSPRLPACGEFDIQDLDRRIRYAALQAKAKRQEELETLRDAIERAELQHKLKSYQ